MLLTPTRIRLLEATLTCVSEHGLSATTKEISYFADVSPATLFGYYGSKQLLLRAAYGYAATCLFRPGLDLPGDTVYEQLHALWFRTATQALQHRDAFLYWALYRSTPGYGQWSFPAEMQLEAFEVVGRLVHYSTQARAERGRQADALAAWQWAAQWTSALHVALPLRVLGERGDWLRGDLPSSAQVLSQAFEVAWQSLGLSPQLRADQGAYG